MMNATARSVPRWLIVTVVGALLAAVALAGAGGARAQDNTDTTPTATADSTATATSTADTTVAAADTSSSADFAVGDSVVVADGPLNLRSEAGTAADIANTLATGATLTITDGPVAADNFTWYEVKTDADETGWVAGEFLGASVSATFAKDDVVEVVDGPLNVRDAAAIDANVLAKLDTGATGTILDGPTTSDGYDWYKISYNGASTGWVAGEFLAETGSSGASGNADFAVGDAVIVAVDNMNFRAAAGTDADVLDTLDLNALFVVRDGPVDADGYTWYKVFNYYYGEGWAAGELMTPSAKPFPGDGGS
jgi:uncharacterized protein YgiM (DUF1202 family)